MQLHIVNEQICSGDDVTYTCSATGTVTLVWKIASLPGFTGDPVNRFGDSLSHSVERITSPDTSSGTNPSIITIVNVTAADNGATVQCRIVNGALSEVITLSLRE